MLTTDIWMSVYALGRCVYKCLQLIYGRVCMHMLRKDIWISVYAHGRMCMQMLTTDIWKRVYAHAYNRHSDECVCTW